MNGQKCNLGKRSASREETMQGPGEMARGRVATRGFDKKAREDLLSSPEYPLFLVWAKKFKKKYKDTDEEIERFKIWRSRKEWVEAKSSKEPDGCVFGLNFFADLKPIEMGEFYGRSMAPNPYRGNGPTPEFYESKYGKEVAEEEAAFAKWVMQHNKKYADYHDRKERFGVYVHNKKIIERVRNENPDTCLNYPPDLDGKLDQLIGFNRLKSLLLNGYYPSNEGCSAPSN